MRSTTITIFAKQQCLSAGAIWLHAASLLSSRFMGTATVIGLGHDLVKYGPHTGNEDRMQEVRG